MHTLIPKMFSFHFRLYMALSKILATIFKMAVIVNLIGRSRQESYYSACTFDEADRDND